MCQWAEYMLKQAKLVFILLLFITLLLTIAKKKCLKILSIYLIYSYKNNFRVCNVNFANVTLEKHRTRALKKSRNCLKYSWKLWTTPVVSPNSRTGKPFLPYAGTNTTNLTPLRTILHLRLVMDSLKILILKFKMWN